MQNIELKATYPDLNHGRQQAEALGATFSDTLHQVDTYFHARFGRLKLREFGGGKPAELIAYERTDEPRARKSDYEICRIDDAESLRRSLSRALGIKVIVTKQRELWLWENVRIHLDAVENLGSFIEFEAVLEDETQVRDGHRQLADLAHHFGISAADVQQTSYAELLVNAVR